MHSILKSKDNVDIFTAHNKKEALLVNALSIKKEEK
jgi:hypothetical protein